MVFFLMFMAFFLVIHADPLSDYSRERRAAGSTEVSIQDYPYAVTIEYQGFKGTYQHKCSGVILSSHSILTACHCGSKSRKVRSGSLQSGKGGTVHRITNMICQNVNETRNGFLFGDLAVLEIYPPIAYDQTRQPIKALYSYALPNDYVMNGSAAMISYGKRFKNDNYGSSHYNRPLQRLQLPLISKTECGIMRANMSKYYRPQVETHLCFGEKSAEARPGSCYGDSGSPLVLNDTFLIGITVLGGPSNCDKPTGPTLFTEVASYYDWIRSNTISDGGDNDVV